jgi:hypothetical protein
LIYWQKGGETRQLGSLDLKNSKLSKVIKDGKSIGGGKAHISA